MSNFSAFWLIIYFFVLVGYAFWSFGLTDPNLVLSTWAPYWNFQQWSWNVLFHNRPLLSGSFVFLSVFAFIAWYSLVRSLSDRMKLSHLIVVMGILALPLVFSYNALSHDVFNYIFNAKMVLVYKEDPHLNVALNFPDDPWTRFMHNTHTPAPYGYGWTFMSLFPYVLGMGKFTLTWLIFRGVNLIALPLLLWLLIQLAKKMTLPFSMKDAALVFLHPLVLIEVVSNDHNDLWMLIPAVAAFWLLYRYKKECFTALSASITLFILSVATKTATILLLPFWLVAVWNGFRDQVGKSVPQFFRCMLDTAWAIVQANFGLLVSVALFMPLLTPRSQFFHPWYLIWSLCWLPMIKVRWWRTWLIAISVSSLFRYMPWLLAGGFSEEILRQQNTITWMGAMLAFCFWLVWSMSPRLRKQ